MIVLEARRGQAEPFEINLAQAGVTMPLDSDVDKLWFTAKRNTADSDEDAAIQKGTATATLSGMAITDEAEGLVELILDPADTENLTDRVLVYDIQYRGADGLPLMIQWGFLYLLDSVTQTDS